VDALASALGSVLQDDDKARVMGGNGLDRAKKYHNADINIERTTELYERQLESHGVDSLNNISSGNGFC
jgi:hypothetical protein